MSLSNVTSLPMDLALVAFLEYKIQA